MTLNDYQQAAQRTANAKTSADKLLNACLGLAGEVGEFCDPVKKYFFQGHDLEKEELKKELGDILWYVAEAACAIGCLLDDVARDNLDKLEGRYPDGFDPERSMHREGERT